MQKTIFAICSLILFQGCSTLKSSHSSDHSSKSGRINQLADDYFESYLKLYPLFATSIGDHRFDDQLTLTLSAEHRQKELALVSGTLAKLKEWGCNDLDHQDTLTCEVLTRDLTTEEELIKNDLEHWMPFNQFDSFFSDFAEISSGSSYVSFDNATNYRNFLKRADRLPAFIDTMIENMKQGMKKGIVTPRVLVDKALKQIHELLPKDFRQSVFYKPVAKLNQNVKDAAENAAIKSQYEQTIQKKIYPAYQKLESFVKKEYRPQARQSYGVYAIPGGRNFYLSLVKYHTTTELKPEEIMNLGLSEVKRIRGEFEKVKKQFGFKGPLKDFYKTLRKETPQLYPFHTADEVLNAYHAIHTKVMAQIPEHFHLMPKAKFEIREVEKFKAENASEAYQNGSADGSRPGIFWVPVPRATKYPVKDMESLFLHEAIPGHHFQISIQQELTDIPRYRRFNGNNAYVEGWALYTESLGKDLGMYSDPYQWIGRLTGEMHRAIRLVVDTGMHWKAWSRERAIKYSMDNEPGDAAGIVTEIERYLAIPGQALSYKLGELKIQELKLRAKAKLGTKYSDRDFHDEILKDGALPLSVLDRKISKWIDNQL